MKPLVIIPARGGSKGVPKKNIKLIGNKPLIQYTIEAAREIFEDNQICVSSDNEDIIKVVENIGIQVPFVRPEEFSTDQASSFDVIKHAYDFYRKHYYSPNTIILLQPTSPFRTSTHLKEAWEVFKNDCEMVVSVKETKANPYFTLKEENDVGYLMPSKMGNFTRRQDCPKVYELNGAIYIFNANLIETGSLTHPKKTKKYLMDDLSSIDIDTPLDFLIAEQLINKVL